MSGQIFEFEQLEIDRSMLASSKGFSEVNIKNLKINIWWVEIRKLTIIFLCECDIRTSVGTSLINFLRKKNLKNKKFSRKRNHWILKLDFFNGKQLIKICGTVLCFWGPKQIELERIFSLTHFGWCWCIEVRKKSTFLSIIFILSQTDDFGKKNEVKNGNGTINLVTKVSSL